MAKIYVKHKKMKVPHPSPDRIMDIIELEIDGRVINQVKREVSKVRDFINNFYLVNPTGKAFIIRQSKMNFKTIFQQQDYE